MEQDLRGMFISAVFWNSHLANKLSQESKGTDQTQGGLVCILAYTPKELCILAYTPGEAQEVYNLQKIDIYPSVFIPTISCKYPRWVSYYPASFSKQSFCAHP